MPFDIFNSTVWQENIYFRFISGPVDIPYESYNFVGSVEIYNPAEDIWRDGPNLPYTAFTPGKFVSHGQALIYAGGYDLTSDTDFGKQMHQLNKEKDGWTFVSEYK